MGRGHLLNIGIETFILMFNALDDKAIKDRVLDELKNAALADPRAHPLRGICLKENGTLYFSEERYKQSFYRGKVGTYSKGIQERLESALREAEIFLSMKSESNKAEATINDMPGIDGLCAISDLFNKEEEGAFNLILAFKKAQEKLVEGEPVSLQDGREDI